MNTGEVTPGQLTGKVKGRIGLFGRIIMMVEVYRIHRKYSHNHPVYTCRDYDGQIDLETCWREATKDDLTSSTVFCHD